MDGLAPTLQTLIEVQFGIENGNSLKQVLDQKFSSLSINNECAKELAILYMKDQTGQDTQTFLNSISSPQRRVFFELVIVGIRGQSILNHLKSLRKEVEERVLDDIAAHIESLPLKMLPPLLLLQFPAFLIIFLGPIVREFLVSLGDIA